MEKVILRNKILKKRNALSLQMKKQYDELILKTILNSEIYKSAQKIFVYISFGSEVHTKEIIKDGLLNSKDIYVPKTNKANKTMVAVRIDSLQELVVSKMGILEPKYVDKNKVSDSFDLIIMPGVVFDKSGNRIGYGGGYYDKYFSQYKYDTVKLALAYEIQIIDFIDTESHDIKVNYVVSEKKAYLCQRNGEKKLYVSKGNIQ